MWKAEDLLISCSGTKKPLSPAVQGQWKPRTKARISLYKWRNFTDWMTNNGKYIMPRSGQGFPAWENLRPRMQWRLLGECSWRFWRRLLNLLSPQKWSIPLLRANTLPSTSSWKTRHRPLPKKAVGSAAPPFLAMRFITRVKSQHDPAGNVLGLIKKERDYTFKRPANLAHMYHHVPTGTRAVHVHMGLNPGSA